MRSTIHSVRTHVAALRAALRTASVDSIESALPALQEAAQLLWSLQREAAAAPGTTRAELREEIEALATDLRASQALIGHGLAFIRGWAGFLAAATAGYRPDGAPAPLAAQGSISVEA